METFSRLDSLTHLLSLCNKVFFSLSLTLALFYSYTLSEEIPQSNRMHLGLEGERIATEEAKGTEREGEREILFSLLHTKEI